jgi:hypothetical protein
LHSQSQVVPDLNGSLPYLVLSLMCLDLMQGLIHILCDSSLLGQEVKSERPLLPTTSFDKPLKLDHLDEFLLSLIGDTRRATCKRRVASAHPISPRHTWLVFELLHPTGQRHSPHDFFLGRHLIIMWSFAFLIPLTILLTYDSRVSHTDQWREELGPIMHAKDPSVCWIQDRVVIKILQNWSHCFLYFLRFALWVNWGVF